MATGLQITGMREFRAGLRKAGGSQLTRFVAAGNKAVAKTVLAKIQTRAKSTYMPRAAAADIAKAITASGTQRRAGIRMNKGTSNKRKKSMIFAAEFGTYVHNVGGGRVVGAGGMKRRVFNPWSGNQWTQGSGPDSGVGFAVFPVIREERENIAAEYLTHIEKAFFAAYPERD